MKNQLSLVKIYSLKINLWLNFSCHRSKFFSSQIHFLKSCMQRLFRQDIKIMLIFKVCRDLRAFVNVHLFPDFSFFKINLQAVGWDTGVSKRHQRQIQAFDLTLNFSFDHSMTHIIWVNFVNYVIVKRSSKIHFLKNGLLEFDQRHSLSLF